LAAHGACAAIAAAALVFLALLALNLWNHQFYTDSAAAVLYYFGLPAALAAATLAMLFLSAPRRLAVALSLAASVPALYAAEFYIAWAHASRLEETAAARGAEVDRRKKIEVIAALRQAGVPAYPATRAKDLLIEGEDGVRRSPLAVGGREFLPLAGVPERTIVACNESGRWLVYRSDRHGFRNPPEAWTRTPALALVGDSFVHGDCVGSEDNLAALLGRRASVLNLGIAGFGPLSMLASVKEYLPALKPRTVLWFFFEGNDIADDLVRERRSPLLVSYLQPRFRQGLAERQDEISRHLAAYLDAHMAEAMSRIDHPYEEVIDHLKLRSLRESFGIDPLVLGATAEVNDDLFDLFRAALAEAKREIESWGGRLTFVYLPDSTRYFGADHRGPARERIRERVLAEAAGLWLPVVDVHLAFLAEPDPRALFQYPGSHYNEAGYRAVAAAVERTLCNVGVPMAAAGPR
jgi:hypothetical protein